MAAAALAAFVLVALTVAHDTDSVRETVDGAGAWAPLAFVGLGALLTVAFFPFPVTAAAAGLLFGILEATLLALLAETLGATIAFLIARRVGGDAIGVVAPKRLTFLLEAIERRAFVTVLYIRIFPGVPRHPANYLCGVAGIPLVPFVAATLIGTAPRAYAYVALGGSLSNPFGSPQAFAAAATLLVMGLLGVFLVRRDLRGRGQAQRGRTD